VNKEGAIGKKIAVPGANDIAKPGGFALDYGK
jgi:hypothetical protein